MADTSPKFSTPIPKWRLMVFHPLTVLGTALLAGLLFALFVINRFEGNARSYYLFYFLPIGFPFVAFLFDRVQHLYDYGLLRWTTDLVIVSLALMRAVIAIPFISGHALFLSFALLTTRSWLTRILALLVLGQVTYLKVFVWFDPTLWGGLGLGCLAAVCFRFFSKEKR